MPERIQLRRTKGWRKGDAIVVSRPSKWGNPYKVRPVKNPEYLAYGRWYVDDGMAVEFFGDQREAAEYAVQVYRHEIGTCWLPSVTAESIRSALAGHDLACWCPLDQPCHADVLLEVANA